MEEFLLYLIKNLVKHPDDVSLRQEETEDGTLIFYIKVNPEDIGKVIGKGGKVIWSLRTLLRVRAQQEGRRTLVKLEEENNDSQPQPETTKSMDQPPAAASEDAPTTTPTDVNTPQPAVPPTESAQAQS